MYKIGLQRSQGDGIVQIIKYNLISGDKRIGVFPEVMVKYGDESGQKCVIRISYPA